MQYHAVFRLYKGYFSFPLCDKRVARQAVLLENLLLLYCVLKFIFHGMGGISTDNGRFKFNSLSKINNIGYKSVTSKWLHLKINMIYLFELTSTIHFNAGHLMDIGICCHYIITVYQHMLCIILMVK